MEKRISFAKKPPPKFVEEIFELHRMNCLNSFFCRRILLTAHASVFLGMMNGKALTGRRNVGLLVGFVWFDGEQEEEDEMCIFNWGKCAIHIWASRCCCGSQITEGERERERQSSAIQMHMREFCIATQSHISTKFVYGQLKSVFLQKSCFCKKPLLDNMCTVTRRRGNTKGKRRLLMFFLPVVIFSVWSRFWYLEEVDLLVLQSAKQLLRMTLKSSVSVGKFLIVSLRFRV